MQNDWTKHIIRDFKILKNFIVHENDKLLFGTIDIFLKNLNKAKKHHFNDRFETSLKIPKRLINKPMFKDGLQITPSDNLIWIQYKEKYEKNDNIVPLDNQAPKRGFLVIKNKEVLFAYSAFYFESMKQWFPGAFTYIIFKESLNQYSNEIYSMAIDFLQKKNINFIQQDFASFKKHLNDVSYFPIPQSQITYDRCMQDSTTMTDLMQEEIVDIVMLNIALILIYDPQRF